VKLLRTENLYNEQTAKQEKDVSFAPDLLPAKGKSHDNDAFGRRDDLTRSGFFLPTSALDTGDHKAHRLYVI
jgi:hypothetical protein